MFQTLAGAVVPKGCFNVTLTAVAQTIAQLIGTSLPAGTKHFVILTEAAIGARWTDATADPTTATGILLPAGVPFEIWNAEARLPVLKFCRDGGVNTTASIWLGA